MLRKIILCCLSISFTYTAFSQSVNVNLAMDTSDAEIKGAIHFLQNYLDLYKTRQKPKYTTFWCAEDCKRTKVPDDMVFAITSDGPTYGFGDKPTIFFAAKEKDAVHLKALFTTVDSLKNVTVWAITNHYVISEAGQPKFISELALHKKNYNTVKNGNVTYHLPASVHFNKAVSDRMLTRLKQVQHDWGFKPVNIDYYYASDGAALARMRGFDYVFNMDENTPSGITSPEQKVIFCQGLGEDYLHEALHIYFNPVYEQSPMCHALIYYLAGGLGHDFNWMIHRMNEYLRGHPETDLSQYEHLLVSDRMLHADHVIKGVLCKMIDEKDGIAGLKRALQYKSGDELLKAEFGVTGEKANDFLKTAFAKYDHTPSQ